MLSRREPTIAERSRVEGPSPPRLRRRSPAAARDGDDLDDVGRDGGRVHEGQRRGDVRQRPERDDR